MRYVLTRDAEEFAARTERLLSERIECNVLATVLMRVLDGGLRDPGPLFAYGLATGDEVRFAALRTPPFPLLASPLGDDAGGFVEQWLKEDPEVAAVTGVPETARAIATAWARRTGGSTRIRMHEAMHVLGEVRDPPRPAPGALRIADPDDRDLLVGWMEEFVHEANLAGATQAAAMVDASMRRQGLLVWEDGRPVSMIGVNPAVAGVVRIGPVYTPPPCRRRGYAGSAVAAASRRALVADAQRCMLFTDLANPTSNKIYAEVGYCRVGDWEEIELGTG
ncbi:MAG TPA: GNAT family N-acetyltransferase [Solirubrobacteraceae bacterium]|nr:GNAT family N-acetyltransferase [Solirubrobacteraceae bacterium]